MSSYDKKLRKWVFRTKEHKLRNWAARNRKYKEKRKWLAEYKKKKGCLDCGETDPVVLQFDHRSRKHKKFTISKVSYNYSLKTLQKEIKKCDVRCANCHARRSYYLKHSIPHKRKTPK